MDRTLIDRVEAQLLRIPDVIRVAIDHSERDIEAIHVLARDSRRPKQIVRDVISSLRTTIGLSVDHKRVSVVIQGSERAPSPAARRPAPAGRDGRVVVQSTSFRDYGTEAEAEVILRYRDRETIGSASGAGSGTRTLRLMAQSTAQALERLLAAGHRVDIGEVRDEQLGARRVVLVSVSVVSRREEFTLLGVAWADEDPRRAAVYATLNAVNRVFGRVELRERIEYQVEPESRSPVGTPTAG